MNRNKKKINMKINTQTTQETRGKKEIGKGRETERHGKREKEIKGKRKEEAREMGKKR